MSLYDWFGLALVVIAYGGLGYLIWRFGFQTLYDLYVKGVRLAWDRLVHGPPSPEDEDERRRAELAADIDRLERELEIGPYAPRPRSYPPAERHVRAKLGLTETRRHQPPRTVIVGELGPEEIKPTCVLRSDGSVVKVIP